MSGERTTGPTAEASRSILPPVFTRWSPQEPPAQVPVDPQPPTAPTAGVDGARIGMPMLDDPFDAPDAAPEPMESADDFPMDAFFIPEGSEFTTAHDAGGASTESAEPTDEAVGRLADRLEQVARLLRTDGQAAFSTLAKGDRLDAMIAGLLAGVLASDDA